MIPTMMVAGLVVGPVWLDHRSRRPAVLVAAALTLAWGAAVGASDGWSFDTFLVGTGLGLANLLVGAVVAIGLAQLFRTLRRA